MSLGQAVMELLAAWERWQVDPEEYEEFNRAVEGLRAAIAETIDGRQR